MREKIHSYRHKALIYRVIHDHMTKSYTPDYVFGTGNNMDGDKNGERHQRLSHIDQAVSAAVLDFLTSGVISTLVAITEASFLVMTSPSPLITSNGR